VPVQISRKRNKIVRDTVAKSSLKFRGSFLGKTLIALWEKATPLGDNNWEMQGLTDNYLRVRAIASSNLWNLLSPIRILKVEENDLFSEIIHG
jgi:tRNA A37 methylthiotransferase MiaB